jgi:hypothetical protein
MSAGAVGAATDRQLPESLAHDGASAPTHGAGVDLLAFPSAVVTRSGCSSRVQLCRNRRHVPALEARAGEFVV